MNESSPLSTELHVPKTPASFGCGNPATSGKSITSQTSVVGRLVKVTGELSIISISCVVIAGMHVPDNTV